VLPDSNTSNDSKIKELEEKLAKKDTETVKAVENIKQQAIKKIKEKDDEIKNLKEKESLSNIKTDLVAGIVKQDTFGGGFKNGYTDGSVKKEKERIALQVIPIRKSTR